MSHLVLGAQWDPKWGEEPYSTNIYPVYSKGANRGDSNPVGARLRVMNSEPWKVAGYQHGLQHGDLN